MVCRSLQCQHLFWRLGWWLCWVILFSHHTCYSNASSFQGKGITEVKLQYITKHKAQCHQITCQSWTVGKGTYTQTLRLRCANILGVLLDRNRVTVIEFTVMVSAKQPSQLWQIGRPSGPISLALISVPSWHQPAMLTPGPERGLWTMISDIKPPEIEIHFLASRRRGVEWISVAS